MRIKYDNIKPNENIVWIEPEVTSVEGDNVFSIQCKVKDRYSGKQYLKDCVYTTQDEAERKRKVWNKIFKKESV